MDTLSTPYLQRELFDQEEDLWGQDPRLSAQVSSPFLMYKGLEKEIDDEVWMEGLEQEAWVKDLDEEDYEVVENSCSCQDNEVEWEDKTFEDEVDFDDEYNWEEGEDLHELGEVHDFDDAKEYQQVNGHDEYVDEETEFEWEEDMGAMGHELYDEEHFNHDHGEYITSAEDDFIKEGFYDELESKVEEYVDWEPLEDEMNEWEVMEDDNLEEDFIGFGLSPSWWISNVEFDGTSLPTVKGPENIGQEYYDPNNSGNPLLDTGPRNRKKKLSKNFSVAELAQSGNGKYKFYKARIDKDLVSNLQRLRDFLFNKPIKVIDGYYSYKHLQRIAKRKGLRSIPNSPHLSGQGAKIKVRGMSGTELAKAIVIACDSDVSISVGYSSVAIYVKQAGAKVTSYIGNKPKRRAARSYISRFRKLHINKPEVLEKELQEAYRNFKVSIAHKMNRRNHEISFPWNRIKKAALYLRQEMQVADKDVLTEILFHTKVFTTLRHHSSYDLTKRLNRADVFGLIDLLQNRREGAMPMDTSVRRVLLNTAVAPVFGLKAPPKSQTGSLDQGSTGERKLAVPNPDKPTIDLTGKYEGFFTKADKKYQGVTLCLNQAGNRVEGVISLVYRPSFRYTEERTYDEVYGELKPEGYFQMFYRNTKVGGDVVLESIGDGFVWKFSNYDKGYVNKIKLKRTAFHPIMLSHAISAFPKSEQGTIKAYEWFPLLSTQHRALKLQLTNNMGEIEKRLKAALTIGSRSYEKSNQSVAIHRLDSFFGEIFETSKIHASDKERAGFYIRSLLVQKKLKLEGRRTQSLLDWMQFMIQSMDQNNYIKYNALTYIPSYLGLKPLGRKYGSKRHRYKITIDVKGATFVFGGYRGSIEIEKLKGTGSTWKERFKVSFGAGGVSLSEFKKAINLDFTKSITAVGESYLEWQPPDIPGWIKIGEGSASLGPLGAEAGFIHIDGADYIPMMEAFFVQGPKMKDLISGSIDLSNKKARLDLDSPYRDPKKLDVGFGGLVGRIHKKGLPEIDYSTAVVQNTFLANYYYENKVHFALGSALLRDSAREAIRIMCAQELNALTNPLSKIRIIAHTDRVDTHSRNMALSAMRAANVRQAIEDILGNKLKARFVQVSGKGEIEAKGVDKDGKENSKYRRVDVFLNTRLVLRLSAL